MTPGIRLGPYEVVGRLGAGGMGEVYRARDTKLNRDVALKVLPEAFALDAERRARFTREAQVLAALNHPNIAAIYGVEDSGTTTALVMELVEGEDLSAHIARGALPFAEVRPIARQIAEALEAAHEAGIVHRDLKPQNIKLREDGTVKVLDFGLAKALDTMGASAATDNSPTITSPAMTQRGVILGTAAYMAPEQARGKAVDKRADIWAFGAVLYEMLSGRRAFAGEDLSDVLAAVLRQEVDWSALPAGTPAGIRTLLARCLERDVTLRLRDIGEARVELGKTADARGSAPATGTASPAARRSTVLPWGVALVALVVAAYAGWTALGRSSAGSIASSQHLRLNLDPAESLLGSAPAEISLGGRRPSRTAIAFSPNGEWLAFTGEQNGTQQLFVRDMSRDSGAAIAGTVGADNPFFSPDGRSIGFWSNGALRKVPVEGGPVVEICRAARVSGADWGADGRILFSANDEETETGLVANTGKHVIRLVSADGGAASVVTTVDVNADENEHRLPRWVTSDWFLYTVATGSGRRHLMVQRLGGSERRMLVDDATDGRLVAAGRYLVFMRGATLMGVPFDRSRVQTVGAIQGVIDGVQVSLNAGTVRISVGAGQYTVSESGTLAYFPGQAFANMVGPLTWLDRRGRTEPIDMESRSYLQVRLAPDGRRAAVSSYGPAGDALWIHDFDRHTTVKVPSDLGGRPIWTPDGRGIVVGSRKGIYRIPADGSGVPERLPGGTRQPYVAGWSGDGRELVYTENVSTSDGGSGSFDIFAVSLAGKTPRPLVQTRGQDAFPAVSPDGKWLAYSSDESGQAEVMVQPYNGGARVPISLNGGTAPAWTRDGKALIYSKISVGPTSGRIEMWEVPVVVTSGLRPGTPRKFADLAQEDFATANPVTNYDVAPDGRVLGTTRHNMAPPPGKTLNVITNWFDELRAKVPATK